MTVSYKKKKEQGINSDHDRGGLGDQAEAQEELWGGSQGTLSSEPGWDSCLHCCLLPSLVCLGGHRCLYASLGLALTPPHLKVSLQFTHGDLATTPRQALPPPRAEGKPGRCLRRLSMAGIFNSYDSLPWDYICIRRGFKRINPLRTVNQCHLVYSSCHCTKSWQWLGLCSESRVGTEGLAQSQ